MLKLFKAIFGLLVIFHVPTAFGQVSVLEEYKLPHQLKESSGIEFYKNNLLAHNDSGDAAFLYELDKLGNYINFYPLSGSSNFDWEDITFGKNQFFVGDFGNNFGLRKNFIIYIVDNDLKPQGKIQFKYSRQSTSLFHFERAYNAEALAFFKNNLLLFSKSYPDTEVYLIPAKPGNYSITSSSTLKIKTPITAADYHEKENILVLVGSSHGKTFLYRYRDFDLDKLRSNSYTRYKLPFRRAITEAVKIIDQNTFWLTTERGNNLPARLFKVRLN